MGLNVELEHGLRDPETNVTNDGPFNGENHLGASKRVWGLLSTIGKDGTRNG